MTRSILCQFIPGSILTVLLTLSVPSLSYAEDASTGEAQVVPTMAPQTPAQAPPVAPSVEAPPERTSVDESNEVPSKTNGLTLEEAQRICIERNPSIKSVALEIERAEGIMQQAWSSVLPILGVGLQYRQADEPTVVSFSMGDSDLFGPAEEIVVAQQHVAQLQVTATQPIFNGQSIPAIRLSHLGRDLSRLSVEQVQQTMALTVARAFYATLSLRRTVDLLGRNLELGQQHVDAARARLNAQAGLAIDVARAELQVEATRSARERTLLGFENARDSLALLMGVPPGEIQQLVEPGANEADLESPEELVDHALASRLDLRIAQRQIRAAELNVQSAWMSYLPSLNLSWQLSYTLSDLGSFGDRRSMWNLVLIANFPVFEGGRRYGQLRERRAQLEQARLNEEAIQQSTVVQVRQAYRGWQTALTTLQSAIRQHELAFEAHRLARAAYEAGAASNLEVVEAQRALISAEVDREIQRLSVQLSLIELMSALEISPQGGVGP